MQNSQWLLITPLRRNTPNHGNPITYRYPSPGSVYQENQALDYKTAFQQTHYNVRYAEPTINQRSEGRSSFTSFNDGINPVRRLVLLKLLKESDVDNQAIVKEAKARFKAAYGFDIDQPHVADDLRLNLPKKTDREGIREFQQQNIIFESIAQRQNLNSTIQKIQKPNILQFESFDLYDAPHFKQNRVQLQYKLDQIKKLRAQEGVDGLITRQGSANYWKPLDDYNDPKNVKRVQSAIGDPEPTEFTRNIAKVKFQFDKDGNVVDIHRIKQKSNE